MIWPFLAVFFSGWIYIEAAYRGLLWQQRVFKPLTLLLLLSWAWMAPVTVLQDYFIPAALLAALAGSGLTLVNRPQLTWALGALFLSALLYSFHLMPSLRLSSGGELAIGLVVLGLLAIGLLWKPLAELRWPAIVMLIMQLVLCWLACAHWLALADNRSFSVMAGAILLLLSTLVWFFSEFRKRFSADCAIYEAMFIIGHFLIVRSLWLF